VNVGRLRLHSGDLALRTGALLKLSHLLALYGQSSDLLTEDDITNFTGSQRRDADAVPLAEVSQDKILHCNPNFDPLIICKSGPDEVRLCDGRLVGV